MQGLKPFRAIVISKSQWGLTCPRRDCGHKFIVNKKHILALKAAKGIKTITCPYCSRVSRIPN